MRSTAYLLGEDAASGSSGAQLVIPSDAAQQVTRLRGHAAVPFRSAPVYLRLVNTKSKALDYAAGGFHVCVTRALSGGCKDTSLPGGFGGAKCSRPLGDKQLTDDWYLAGASYLEAFDAAFKGKPLAAVKDMIRTANLLADKAFKAEGGEPPRDPGPTPPGVAQNPPEPALMYKRRFSPLQTVAASAGVMAAVAAAFHYGARRARKSGGYSSWF